MVVLALRVFCLLSHGRRGLFTIPFETESSNVKFNPRVQSSSLPFQLHPTQLALRKWALRQWLRLPSLSPVSRCPWSSLTSSALASPSSNILCVLLSECSHVHGLGCGLSTATKKSLPRHATAVKTLEEAAHILLVFNCWEECPPCLDDFD